MTRTSKRRASSGLGVVLAGALALAATAAAAQTVKLVVPSFLTGAGSKAFGIPARNGAELIIRAINDGALPVPYDSVGLAGRPISPIFLDEAGGAIAQAARFRKLANEESVDLFVGYNSSDSCIAISRIAERARVMVIQTGCTTPRIFETLIKNPKYVFRTTNHATANHVSAARAVLARLPDKITGYIGLYQNYSWGRESWRGFSRAMSALAPHIPVAKKQLAPKLFSSLYRAEIAALLRAPYNVVHSSLWGGDLEAFIKQAKRRKLFRKKVFVLTAAESVIYRMGRKFPQGVIVSSGGPYGIHASQIDTPLNIWFRREYRRAYGAPPLRESYLFAQGILAAKHAYDKAAAEAGRFPSTDEVAGSLTGAEFPSLAGSVRMRRSQGHQAVTDDMWGVATWDERRREMVVRDVTAFPAKCIMPPDGVGSRDWIRDHAGAADCDR